MPRPFASGQIAFGLVSIPVKLYSATEASERISFNMLHTECGTRIQQQLFYPNEIRSQDELDLGEAIVKDNELKMAIQLAEMGAADEFHPENYRDEVADRIRALIQRKIDGEEITIAAAEEPRAQVIDLMEALKASLARPKNARESGSKAAPKLAIKAEAKRKPARSAPRKVAAAKSRAR